MPLIRRQRQWGSLEFMDSLVYRTSSRTARLHKETSLGKQNTPPKYIYENRSKSIKYLAF